MTELIVILVGTVLVNNFVLVRFLGLCPFMGVSRNLEAAAGMSLATTFVLTLSSATAYLLYRYVLLPLDLEYLRTIGFILIIAASVQFTEIMVRRMSPLLDQVLGIFIPLIVTNCVIIGRAEAFASRNPPLAALADGLATGLGFCLALVLLGALREIVGRGTLFSQAQLMFGEFGERLQLTLIPDHPGFLLAMLPPGAFIALAFLAAIFNWSTKKTRTAS